MPSLRRLAKDHAALQSSLPPNYIFPDTEDASSYTDDLTQLVVLVTGADGTPYAQGLWRLHLKIPIDYPKNPPKATFKTRIYHPNVDEKSGAVCLETLKRDWDPNLTLKDILITISCLLIQPNPDSALNAAAGALIQENYDAFTTQAQLMTKIHAPIPKQLSNAVEEAKRRGEEVERKTDGSPTSQEKSEEDDTKENDPRKPSEPSACLRASPQSHIRGKRPLSELPAPEDSTTNLEADAEPEPKRKSPRVTRLPGSATSSTIAAPVNDSDRASIPINVEQQGILSPPHQPRHVPMATARKASATGTTRQGLPRVGIRRL